MTYKVELGNLKISCDSYDEVLALAGKIAQTEAAPKTKRKGFDPRTPGVKESWVRADTYNKWRVKQGLPELSRQSARSVVAHCDQKVERAKKLTEAEVADIIQSK